MIIKNIETGKRYQTTKAKWDGMKPKSRKLFEVIQQDDEVKQVEAKKKPLKVEEKISTKEQTKPTDKKPTDDKN